MEYLIQIHYKYSHLDNIASLDFNPNGENVATIDRDGICLISDVNTNNCLFHVKMWGSGCGKQHLEIHIIFSTPFLSSPGILFF